MKIKPLILVLTLISSSVFGQLTMQAASSITAQINALMSDFTDTLVTPTDNPDAVIVISTKIIQTEKVKRMWAFITASAVGKYFNDHPELHVDEIWLADPSDLKVSPIRYSVIQIPVAKKTQRQIHSGSLELEDGIETIWRSITIKTLKKEAKNG